MGRGVGRMPWPGLRGELIATVWRNIGTGFRRARRCRMWRWSKAVTYGKDELRAREPGRQRGNLDLMAIFDRRNHEERTELKMEEASLPPITGT